MEKPLIRIFTNRLIFQVDADQGGARQGWCVNLYQLISPFPSMEYVSTDVNAIFEYLQIKMFK
jgi:hypothetical protein